MGLGRDQDNGLGGQDGKGPAIAGNVPVKLVEFVVKADLAVHDVNILYQQPVSQPIGPLACQIRPLKTNYEKKM